jgi:NAD+ kinase
MQSIGIFTSEITEFVTDCIAKLQKYFPSDRFELLLYGENETNNCIKTISVFSKIEELENPFCIISIGGDGTFIRASHLVAKWNIPIVGINHGRMGFLADIPKEEVKLFANQIISNNFTIEERPFIELHSTVDIFGTENFALNEISITKKDSTHLMTIHTWIDDEYLGAFWADGILIATPTGSTAYSLSLGGPIVTPSSKNLIINTIAPHSLTVRPLIIPDHSEIRLQIEGRDKKYNISLDSKTECFESSTILRIKKSTTSLKIIKIKGKTYFNTLRNKLMWALDIRN